MIDFFIHSTDLASTLRTNGAIEQWIGHKNEEDFRALEWCRIEVIASGRVIASKYDMFDDGSYDFLDIYAFEFIDPENVRDLCVEFSSIEEAIRYAMKTWGTDSSRFVRGGDIQAVYSSFLDEHGLPPQ